MTEVRFKDFSRTPSEIHFTADGERYDCLSAVPPEVLQELLTALKGVKDDPLGALTAVMNLVVEPESAQRLLPRLRKGHTNPLDITQAIDIAKWLTEQYSQRPTRQPNSSSNGSATGDAGTSSTDGPSPEA